MDPIIRTPIVSPRTRQLVRPPARATEPAAATPLPTAYVQVSVASAEALHDSHIQVHARYLLEQQAREAEQQRRETEQQAARIVEQELEEARAEAQESGFAEGWARAEEAIQQAIAERLSQIVSITEQLAQDRAAVLNDAEDLMVETVYAAVCRVIGANQANLNGVVEMVRHVLAGLRQRDALTIRVHPEDAAVLQEAFSLSDGLAGLAPDTVLRADATVELGGCIIDSASGSLDARLETQLQRLRDVLLGVRRMRRQDSRQDKEAI
jgi:flagellar assembly protein FliH